MVHPTQQRSRRRARPIAAVTISDGVAVRTFVFRPWLLATIATAVGLLLPAYIAAAAYLVYRDDLLGASLTQQAEIRDAYEDRIASLRAELDRTTSRYLVETQGVEAQVAALLERQTVLDGRQEFLAGIVAEARQAGVGLAGGSVPLPQPKPSLALPQGPIAAKTRPLAFTSEGGGAAAAIAEASRQGGPAASPLEAPEGLPSVLEEIESSLDLTQSLQAEALESLTLASRAAAEDLSAALAPIADNDEVPALASGGPFIPAHPDDFAERSATLLRLLEQIAATRERARVLPLRTPVAAATVSSGYGNRSDPFLGTPALHAGLDFVAPEGAQVRATAPGTVTSADWSDGYGRMVEISHAGGVTTRYAHLSEILVSAGARVAAGAVIGLVGSTGRSTGPHLHYETRRRGEPVDPALYLQAGQTL